MLALALAAEERVDWVVFVAAVDEGLKKIGSGTFEEDGVVVWEGECFARSTIVSLFHSGLVTSRRGRLGSGGMDALTFWLFRAERI
jgi:hypothetical protein